MKKPKNSNFSIISTRSPDCCRRASAVIGAGGIVGIPTETAYGLAVDPFNTSAVKRLFEVKKRPAAKPVLVLLAGQDEIAALAARIPDSYRPLLEEFWPGPLTLIFPARRDVSPLLTGGTGTIGMRISSNPWTRELCRAAGGAITGTSANVSGSRPARTAVEIARVFGNGVDLVVDGGPIDYLTASTVIAENRGKLRLIRAGRIGFADVEAVLEHSGLP